MKIRFSTHALNQIKTRQIGKTFVLEMIRLPGKTVPSFRGRKLLQKRFGAKMLEVVVKEENSDIVIITAYFLKE